MNRIEKIVNSAAKEILKAFKIGRAVEAREALRLQKDALFYRTHIEEVCRPELTERQFNLIFRDGEE